MSETPAPPQGKRGPRPWLLRFFFALGMLILVSVCFLLAYVSYARFRGGRELEAVTAQLDQQDPEWRWNDLEAHRPAIPDAQNAGVRIEEVEKLMPKPWPEAKQKSRAAAGGPVDLWTKLRELPPNSALSEADVAEIKRLLAGVRPAQQKARSIAAFDTGRFPPVLIQSSGSSGKSPTQQVLDGQERIQRARTVTDLLLLDSALLDQEGKISPALENGRAILVMARTVDEEPALFAQLLRVALRGQALTSIERSLAQGEASAPELKRVQSLLGEEAGFPVLYHAIRGERAQAHENMNWMEATSPGPAPGAAGRPTVSSRVLGFFARSWLKEAHVEVLELLTDALAKADLPPHEQRAAFQALAQKYGSRSSTRTAFAALLVPALQRMCDASLRSLAELRCGIVALAAERYRMAEGHWPDKLEALVPTFLDQVPTDPFDGKPLRFKHLKDGIVIYSVGPDETDDGGNIDRSRYAAPGTDLGFRLWDLKARHQPPPPAKEPATKSKKS